MTISERHSVDTLNIDRSTLTVLPAGQHDNGSELCKPAETALRICLWSRAKCQLRLGRLLVLGILGGVYIGFGGALATLIGSESSLGAGPTRWLSGIAFSLGLVLVVIGGAELSTGNCLMAIARLRGFASGRQLWRNWTWSYAANSAGAVALAWLIVRSGCYDPAPMRSAAVRIAEAKLALTPVEAFTRGVLANVLVCLAVWLAAANQSAIGKVIGIVFPISAFVAIGFEHSIANLYLIPAGLMMGAAGSMPDLASNLAHVTAGNLVGGAVITSGLLWLGHGRVDTI